MRPARRRVGTGHRPCPQPGDYAGLADAGLAGTDFLVRGVPPGAVPLLDDAHLGVEVADLRHGPLADDAAIAAHILGETA